MSVTIGELEQASSGEAAARGDHAHAEEGKLRGPEGVRRMLDSLNSLRQAWLRKVPRAATRS